MNVPINTEVSLESCHWTKHLDKLETKDSQNVADFYYHMSMDFLDLPMVKNFNQLTAESFDSNVRLIIIFFWKEK